MSFNHTRAHDTHDGVNLRRNADENEKIFAPEWCVDGADAGTEPDTCDAALYVRNRQVTVNASFTVAPQVNSAEVRAVGRRVMLDASDVLSLGDLGDTADSWVTVTFTGGSATDVSFTPQNQTANCVLREEALFYWEVNQIDGVDIPPMRFTLAGQRTPIMVYTILGPPRPPWNATDTAGQDINQPWECVLDYITRDTYRGVQWGMGATDVGIIRYRMTWAINQCGRFQYRVECNYIREDPNWYFSVTGFVNQITGAAGADYANCHDVACGVVTFANILGAELRHMYLLPPLGSNYIHTYQICGIGPVGNEVNDGANWRTWDWPNHGVAWEGPAADTSHVYDGSAHVDSDGDATVQPPRTPAVARYTEFTTYAGWLGGNPRRDSFTTFALE